MSIKTSINLSEAAARQAKLLAVAREISISRLVENLIMREFTVDEMTMASRKASFVEAYDKSVFKQKVTGKS